MKQDETDLIKIRFYNHIYESSTLPQSYLALCYIRVGFS
jgi:hypothetical protein